LPVLCGLGAFRRARGGATRFIESLLSVSRLLSAQLANDTVHNTQCRQVVEPRWRARRGNRDRRKHFGVSRHLSAQLASLPLGDKLNRAPIFVVVCRTLSGFAKINHRAMTLVKRLNFYVLGSALPVDNCRVLRENNNNINNLVDMLRFEAHLRITGLKPASA
jgi:hypothetical protein